jgi:hypothetical protein
MKHLLLAIIVATVVIPAIAARDPFPRRGLKRMILLLLLCTALYTAFVTQVFAHQFRPLLPPWGVWLVSPDS